MSFLKYGFLLITCLAAKAGTDPVLLAARADVKKANSFFEKNPNLSVDTYYTVYSEHDNHSPLEGKNGKYITFNHNAYTQIDDIETYKINDKVISINKEDLLISVGDNSSLTEPDPLQANVDSLLTLCSKVEVEQVNASEKKYVLYFSGADVPEFNRVDVHINTQSYRFTRIVLYYAMAINLKSDFYAEETQPRLEITYKNYKLLSAEPPIFNPALYIREENGRLQPAANYSSYKVSDLRNQTRIKKVK